MKKIVCILLVLCLGVSLAFAGGGGDRSSKLICGVTEYEPMNYRAGGKWTGFDTEIAQLVAKKLGLTAEFQLIEWSQKFAELNSRAIDAIWNGFTATASEDGVPRIQLCDMSYSYMLNTQCVVIRTARSRDFTSRASLVGKSIAAEAGSAGESTAKTLAGANARIVGVAAQINSFIEVKSGAVDCAVIDIILARQITGTGDYTDLTIANIPLDDEVYAIGFRKGDPLRDKVNQALKELYDDGTMLAVAKKYGLEKNLVLDTRFGQ